MLNLNIKGFETDKLTENVKSISILRDDGTVQTFNDDHLTISASFTENGTYTPPDGITGYDSVEINVPPSGKLETITVDLNDEAQTIRPSDGFDGIGEVKVPKSNLRSLQVQFTPDNQNLRAADFGYFGFDSVDVPGYNSMLKDVTLQDMTNAGVKLGLSQTVTPKRLYGNDTEVKGFSSYVLPPAMLQSTAVKLSGSEQVIKPAPGYYGLAEVVVPSIYTGLEEVVVRKNGVVPVPSDKYGFSAVTVSVDDTPHRLQSKTVEINRNVYTRVTPDDDYGGLSEVLIQVQVPLTLFYSSFYVSDDVSVDVSLQNYYGTDLLTTSSIYTGYVIQALTPSTQNVLLDIYPILRTNTGLRKCEVYVKYEYDADYDTWRLYLYDESGDNKVIDPTTSKPVFIKSDSSKNIII